MSTPTRVLRAAIREAAKAQRTAATPDDGMAPGYFLDLLVFLVAVNAYRQLKGDADSHLEGALKLLRRYQGDIVAGLLKFIIPQTEKNTYSRFRSPLNLAARTVPGLDHAADQALTMLSFLGVFRTHRADIKEVFSDNRSLTAATKLANLAATDAPETILNGLASVPAASRLQLTRAWVKEAASLAGVAPSEVEEVLADAEAARGLGDDLREVEAKLTQVLPSSMDAASLQDKKQDLLAQIEAVAGSSPSPTVVMSAAATAAAAPKEYATQIGKKMRLSPDQEQALTIRGKGIIAAGAGSGKTRVLASKVVYHIDELGVAPQSIMATSFSRKSAAELRKRIEDYGAEFPKGTDTGLGTTHSISAKLMREYGGGRANRDGMKNYEQTNLVRLAMEQVQMRGGTSAPPKPQSMFTVKTWEALDETPAGAAPAKSLSFADAMNQAYKSRSLLGGFLRGFIEGFFNPGDKWYRMNRGKTRDLTDPYGLTDKQQQILKDVFRYTNVEYNPDTDPVLVAQRGRQAAGKKRDKNKGLREKYPSFSQPLRQWFNLGLFLTEDGKEDGKALPPGHFKQAITKYKGRLISPSEAWALGGVQKGLGPAEAAVYAAYEFLKGPDGESDFRGKGDFDDVLIDVSKMMLTNPRTLKQIQARFRTVLVDEAQDLNRAQHLMFGLITGFVDPAKVPNVAFAKQFAELAKDDGSMTADTYCFIGDDKQAIYEFRGADPETFIDMSDLVEGGAGFKTALLKTNYRSGELIVQAANRLIAHNKKQIPMVCDANPSRTNKGGISRVPFAPQDVNDMSAPALWLAERVEEMMGLGEAEKGYDSFGVGLRTNGEAYTYGIELLKKGIPFRAKVNFFSDPNTKSLLHWLTLADEGIDGNVERINEVVLNARSAPTSMLGQKFADTLTERASGNYLVWLRSNWGDIYGTRSTHAANVKAYLDNLLTVASLKGTNLSNEQLLERLLKLQGFDGSTVEDALVDKIRDDDEAMAELRAASPSGEVHEDDIKEQALAPIAPLTGLLGARSNLTEAMKYVRALQSANSKLAKEDDPDAPDAKQPAVTLGTMHSWKGLEVENMFVAVVGGRFPRSDADEDDLASERRLGYVALTRGENQVYVMDIPTIRMTKQGPVTQKSRFIDELCLSSQPVKVSSRTAEFEAPLPYGMSAHDPVLIDAYLQGKDPYAVAESLGKDSLRLARAIGQHGQDVVGFLASSEG